MGGTKPWPQVPVGNKDHTNAAVVIIGAGISGMCTAIDLMKRNKCNNFVILEKSTGVGGTWHDNKYPGCCCDVWSQLYSYSFATNPDWTREYPGQEEILAYLMSVAGQYDLYPHIRFNSTVESAEWDEENKKWKVKVTTAKGSKDAEFNPEYELKCDFLVSGVGQLNQPRWPDIPAIKDYEGRLMHSARWDWGYDLIGKKIAVIGNGATAAQIIPEIAKVASRVTVYQRTPNWVIPRADSPVSPFTRALYKYVPPLRWRKRATQMDFREGFYGAVIDGNSPLADVIRSSCTTSIESTFPDQPKLREKLTPKYNPGCKRVLITDDYYPALARDNVRLETRPITTFNKTGIEFEGGEEEYDIVVCATGFQTTEFMHPIELYGKAGRALSDIWKTGGRAYYGVTVEDLPNFGMLYGPNTNLGHNSIVLMIEAQSKYINAMITPVIEARKQGKSLSVSVKQERLDEYNNHIQKLLRNSSFNDPNCNSWYKNDAGLITNNWSGTAVEYMEMLAKLDWNDYEVDGSGNDVLAGKKVTKIGRVVEETRVSDTAIALLTVASVAVVGAGWFAKNSKYLQYVSGLRL